MECQYPGSVQAGNRTTGADARKICLVIPTKNEESTIGSVLRNARDQISRISSVELRSILVIDDSQDTTRDIALAEGCVLVAGAGTGLGAAMLKGIREALKFQPDFIVSLDSDGQVDLSEIPRFLEPLLEGSADLVLGSRFQKAGLIQYRYPRINRIGIHLLCWILRRLTGVKVTDSHGGIRAMTAPVARALEIWGTHTYVQEAIIDAASQGFRIREIPSAWLPRVSGESRVVRSIPRYVVYTLPVILARRGLHLWIFYGAGLGFLFLSAFEFAGHGERIPLAYCYLALAVSAVSFGFACEHLIRLRREHLVAEPARE